MKLKLLFLFLGMLGFSQLYANPSINTFLFPKNYYADDNNLAISVTSGTYILYPSFSASRAFKQNSTSLEDVNMEVELVVSIDQVEEVLSPKFIVNTGTYNGFATTNLLNMPMCVVDVQKMLKGKMYLRYRYYDYTQNTWSGYLKTTTQLGTKYIAPGKPYEGDVIRTNDGAIYSVMDGKSRYIQDPGTLAAVYTRISIDNGKPLSVYNLVVGKPIPPGTELLGDATNGRIYFMENTDQGKLLRYITSPAIAAKYNFKISNARSINGTAGYIIGDPIN